MTSAEREALQHNLTELSNRLVDAQVADNMAETKANIFEARIYVKAMTELLAVMSDG